MVESMTTLSTNSDMLRVLFIDDNEDCRNVTSKMLRLLGYDVTVCCSGREAIDTFESDDTGFHAVLTDLEMPEMGGQEVITRIRQTERGQLPIVLFSGAVQPAKTLADEFLSKPATLDQLRHVIDRAIDLRSWQKRTDTDPRDHVE